MRTIIFISICICISGCSSFWVTKLPKNLIETQSVNTGQADRNIAIAIRFPAVVAPNAKNRFNSAGLKIAGGPAATTADFIGFSELTTLSSTYNALELFDHLKKINPNATIVFYPLLLAVDKNGNLVETDLQKTKLPMDVVVDFSTLAGPDQFAFISNNYLLNIRVAPAQSIKSCGVVLSPKGLYATRENDCDSDSALDAPFYAWYNYKKAINTPKEWISFSLPVKANSSIEFPGLAEFNIGLTGFGAARPDYVKDNSIANTHIRNIANIISNIKGLSETEERKSKYLKVYDEGLYNRVKNGSTTTTDLKNIELILKLYKEEKSIQKLENDDLFKYAFNKDFGIFYRSLREKGYSEYNKAQVRMWLTAGLMAGIQAGLVYNGYIPLADHQVNQIIQGSSKTYFQSLAPAYGLTKKAKIQFDEKVIEISYTDSASLSSALLAAYQKIKQD